MDKFPMMLFKAGGPHQLHGLGGFHTRDVHDEPGLDGALKAGWSTSTTEALALADAEALAAERARIERLAAELAAANSKPPTTAELQQKAKELGIAFTKNTPDAELAAAIEAKLKG